MKERSKILIVDDKPANLLTLADTLGKLDTEVIKASCGNDAIKATLNNDFALMILDVLMPEMDGYELARILRTRDETKHIPIIFMTAINSERDYVFKGYQSGAVDYIVKPYDPAILQNKINIFIQLDQQKKLIVKSNELLQKEIIERKQKDRELIQLNKSLEQRVVQRTAELANAKTDAQRANKTKSAFLADMSHEIRSPMNAILGFANVLKEQLKDKQQQKYLATILTNGQDLLALVDDLLDLSKIEAGKVEPKPSTVDIHDICGEIEQIFVWKVLEKELDFSIEVEPSIPAGLFLDRKIVRQVLINLVDNAIKFTQKGFVKLSLLQLPSKKNGFLDLFISVEDSGIGIPEDQHKIIFEPFKTQSGQDVDKYKSKGLGLSITKSLIGIMNGTIFLESVPGTGSVFNVILNDIKIVSDDREEEYKKEKPGLNNISFDKSTVLAVDDRQDNRELLNAFLKNRNLEIMEAGNGKEAVDLARECRPELIIMDLRMPVMNGYEAIKILQNDKDLKSIPVIALTASAMKEDEERVLKAGFNGYLKKPVNLNELLSEMIRFLPYKII
jgi:signal transduction histidine kinase